MKRRFHVISYLLVIFLIGCCCGCSVSEVPAEQSDSDPDINLLASHPILHGRRIYVPVSEGVLCMNSDGSDGFLLVEGKSISRLMIWDDYLYYSNTVIEGSIIYGTIVGRIRLDGSDPREVDIMSIGQDYQNVHLKSIYNSNNTLYAITRGTDHSVFRIEPNFFSWTELFALSDGNNSLPDDTQMRFDTIRNGYLYYHILDADSSVSPDVHYRTPVENIRLPGERAMLPGKDMPETFESYTRLGAYFYGKTPSGDFVRQNRSTGERATLLTAGTFDFVRVGNRWLIYGIDSGTSPEGSQDSMGINNCDYYALNLDTMMQHTLLKDTHIHINTIIDDYIYMFEYEMGTEGPMLFSRINIESGEQQVYYRSNIGFNDWP